MTDILSIPQLPTADESWKLVIATGADFRESVLFLAEVDSETPLDISGVAFVSIIRRADNPKEELIVASTQAGTMTIDGPAGVLSFAVPASATSRLEEGEAICDIVAMADGKRINLCKDNGPLRLTIRAGLA